MKTSSSEKKYTSVIFVKHLHKSFINAITDDRTYQLILISRNGDEYCFWKNKCSEFFSLEIRYWWRGAVCVFPFDDVNSWLIFMHGVQNYLLQKKKEETLIYFGTTRLLFVTLRIKDERTLPSISSVDV